jgi:hypothetical protein
MNRAPVRCRHFGRSWICRCQAWKPAGMSLRQLRPYKTAPRKSALMVSAIDDGAPAHADGECPLKATPCRGCPWLEREAFSGARNREDADGYGGPWGFGDTRPRRHPAAATVRRPAPALRLARVCTGPSAGSAERKKRAADRTKNPEKIKPA